LIDYDATGRRRRRNRQRDDVLGAIKEAIIAADPKTILRENVKLEGESLRILSSSFDLSRYKRILLIGGGKASGKMALELEKLLANRLTGGEITIPDYQDLRFGAGASRLGFNRSTHPIPSVNGVRGVKEMLDMIGKTSSNDAVICLISGGASALLPLPAKGITLKDKADVTRLLLTSGADINEINIVRKHLSSVKGGRLAKLLFPATVISLVISDVVGDRVDSVGSGPTTPDPSTYSDAKRVLINHGAWDKVNSRVRKEIEDGIAGKTEETPKQGSTVFEKVHNFILGSNGISRLRAEEFLRERGYRTDLLRTEIRGEAREVGTRIARLIIQKASSKSDFQDPWAIVAGGEPVVTVKGTGRGGRNQELVLSAAIGIDGTKDVAVGSVATDGIDGPTDAAGAIADGNTVSRARTKGLSAEDYLGRNDSYRFFQKLGDLIITGPTGTNVNDVLVAVGRARKTALHDLTEDKSRSKLLTRE
jgi:glycerate-2-kinase